ncbi:MAG: hypothetical protein P8173_16005 [Gammaproteobacteria bacterium]
MRGSWTKILGKTIEAVVTADDLEDPRSLVFLVFSDGTSFEIFGRDLRGASELDTSDPKAIAQYAKGFGGEVRVIGYSP